MAEPVVSMILLTHNRQDLLARALLSAVRQSYRNLEILIYDDGSTEETERFVASRRDSRIRYVRSAINHGPCIARNRAIAEARGKYICWMDDDDISNIYRVEFQVAVMEKREPPFLRTAAEVLKRKNAEGWKARPQIASWLRWVTPTTMALAEKMREVGYDEEVVCGEDVRWELGMTLRFGTGMVLPYVLYYRDRKPEDRWSKKYSTRRPDYHEFIKLQVTRKQALLEAIAAKGVERWPVQLSKQETLDCLVGGSPP